MHPDPPCEFAVWPYYHMWREIKTIIIISYWGRVIYNLLLGQAAFSPGTTWLQYTLNLLHFNESGPGGIRTQGLGPNHDVLSANQTPSSPPEMLIRRATPPVTPALGISARMAIGFLAPVEMPDFCSASMAVSTDRRCRFALQRIHCHCAESANRHHPKPQNAPLPAVRTLLFSQCGVVSYS